MNIVIDRTMIAQLVIILSLGVGAWMMFVQPALAEINRLEAELLQETDVAPLSTISIEAVTTIADRLKAIRSRNSLAADSSRLYGLIMDHAADHGVTVQTLQPGNEARGDESGRCEVRQIDLTVDGTYQGVADFLHSIDAIESYIRPQSLSLTAFREGGAQLVQAQYACEVLRFTYDEATFQGEGRSVDQ